MPAKLKHKPKAPLQPGQCRHGERAYTRIRGRWIALGDWGTGDCFNSGRRNGRTITCPRAPT